MVSLYALFILYSTQNHLPPGLLSSLCYVESKHNVNALALDDGGSASIGICQLKYKTAKMMGFKGAARQLIDPRTNIKFSAKYLRHQILRYKSVRKGVIAYNRGNSRDLTTTIYQRKVFKEWGSKW